MVEFNFTDDNNYIIHNADNKKIAIDIGSNCDWFALLTELSTLYLLGATIDWKGFDQPYMRKKVLLPTYAFQRKRIWPDFLKK